MTHFERSKHYCPMPSSSKSKSKVGDSEPVGRAMVSEAPPPTQSQKDNTSPNDPAYASTSLPQDEPPGIVRII